MKHLLSGFALLCVMHANAQVIKSDDFFKDDNQRFIQTTDQKISNKDGVTASVFFGITECNKQADTLFSLYFSVRSKKETTIEKGSMITLNFADGTVVSIPDLQQARTVPANYNLTPNCYLDGATWKKLMQVNLTKVTVGGTSGQFNIRIPGSYQNVIPGMVRMLYERGRAPYDESL